MPVALLGILVGVVLLVVLGAAGVTAWWIAIVVGLLVICVCGFLGALMAWSSERKGRSGAYG